MDSCDSFCCVVMAAALEVVGLVGGGGRAAVLTVMEGGLAVLMIVGFSEEVVVEEEVAVGGEGLRLAAEELEGRIGLEVEFAIGVDGTAIEAKLAVEAEDEARMGDGVGLVFAAKFGLEFVLALALVLLFRWSRDNNELWDLLTVGFSTIFSAELSFNLGDSFGNSLFVFVCLFVLLFVCQKQKTENRKQKEECYVKNESALV